MIGLASGGHVMDTVVLQLVNDTGWQAECNPWLSSASVGLSQGNLPAIIFGANAYYVSVALTGPAELIEVVTPPAVEVMQLLF